MFKFHKFFSVFVVFVYFFTTTANAQQIITYSSGGALGDPDSLGRGTGSAPSSFFPSSPSNNNVTVNGTGIKNVYGGIGGSGVSVNGNNTYINDGRVGGVIYGGWSNDSNATSNSVIIGNASVDGTDSGVSGSTSTINTLYGAYIDGGAGASHDNSITVNRGASVRSMYGAYNNSSGSLDGNSITINGGTVGANINGDMIVSGAYAGIGNSGALVSNNSLTINGGTVYGTNMNLYGARGTTSADLEGNYVEITGGTVNVEGIHGGQNVNGTGTVVLNSVDISGGTITATAGIFGGYSTSSSLSTALVQYNMVNISGDATIVNGDIYGGHTINKAANNNYVTIDGGRVTGDIYGAFSENGNITYNGVTVNGGYIDGDLYGGYSPFGSATENILNINGVVTGNIYGGYSDTGAAEANTVNIYGSTIAGDVYGGYNSSGVGVNNNHITISDSTVTGTVYGSNSTLSDNDNSLIASSGSSNVGGIKKFESVDAYSGATIRVTGNTTHAAEFNNLTNNGWVTFVNGSTTQEVATVAGDYSGSGHLGLDVLFSNNATSSDADSIVFSNTPSETVSFYFKALPESVANSYLPMTKIAELQDGGTLNFTTVEHGLGIYSYDIQQDPAGNVLVGLKAEHTDQTTKPYSDAKVAGLAALSFAFDTFMRSSLQQAVNETEGRGFGISITGSASVEQINSGDGIDLDTMSMNASLAYHKSGSPFAVGSYIEFLHSNYKTKNKVITNLGAFDHKASGAFDNIGGGVFLQYRENFYESNGEKNFALWLPGMHIEVAALYGISDMKFKTDSINVSEFDNDNVPYAGLSLGGGYIFDTPYSVAVELYSYGMIIQKSSSDVTDGLGQHIEFEKAGISRFTAGTRTAYTGISYMRPYIGLAMDYEVTNSKIYIDGYAADQSDLSGFSGQFEIGFYVKNEMGLSLNYKLMTSVGKRSGIGGLFEARYLF